MYSGHYKRNIDSEVAIEMLSSRITDETNNDFRITKIFPVEGTVVLSMRPALSNIVVVKQQPAVVDLTFDVGKKKVKNVAMLRLFGLTVPGNKPIYVKFENIQVH